MSLELSRAHFPAALIAVVLASTTALGGVFTTPPAAQAADVTAGIAIATDTPTSVLADEPVEISFTATNSTPTTDLYNLSLSYVLPAGVAYTGPTSPASIGDPTIYTVTDSLEPLVTHQVLVWRNASDLPAADVVSISFSVQPNPAKYPVGSTISGTALGYANSNPRLIPRFNPTTGAATTGYTANGSRDITPIVVSAVDIEKSEPSPEAELMRGVHDSVTTYTLTIRNTDVAATDTVTVVDYLPAGLEFLGCGGAGFTDNSAAATEEYPGSGRLPSSPALTGDTCLTPVSVETVVNPGALTGVYTAVTYTLASLPSSSTTVITYRAAVPLFENTATFGGGAPSPTSLAQGANLDNNTGPSTRQNGAATGYTNSATVSGTYSGATSGGSSAVTDTDTYTIEASDLSIVKSASAPGFVAGGLVTFDLLIRASEYVSDDQIIVDDTLPDGLCLALPAGFPVPAGYPADCAAATGGTVTGGTLLSVTNGSAPNTFDIQFSVPAVAANGFTTVSYVGLMRQNYAGGNPTSAGDDFTNSVAIEGESTPIPNSPETGVNTVTDDSAATLEASGAAIEKKILPRADVADAADCAAQPSSSYRVDAPTNAPQFQLGDRICFELSVTFATSSKTRNALVSDFVPVGTSYDGYALGNEASGNTITDAQIATVGTPDAEGASWALGSPAGSANRYLDQGQKLVMYVTVVVTDASSSSTVDITANLMKYRQQNTAGKVLSLRDQASFGIAPPPTVALTKKLTPAGQVREGDVVHYTLGVSNTSPANGNPFALSRFTVWDALPAGVICNAISAIDLGGVCTNPGAAGHPVFSGSTTRSAIVWTLPNALLPGASYAPQLGYDVTIPTPTSVSTVFTNNASIVSLVSPNSDTSNPADTVYYPSDSLDIGNDELWNTTPANASVTTTVPDSTITKTVTAARNPSTGEALPAPITPSAVAGAWVDYTVTGSIPERTTLFNGRITDTLPTGLSLVMPPTRPVTVTFGGATYDATTLPTGYSLTYDAATLVLTLPPTIDNSGAASDYVIEFTALVSPTFTGTSLTNTAAISSTPTLASTTRITHQANAVEPVLNPNIGITKSATPTTVVSGTEVTFTLTGRNAASATASPGFDTIIVDCLPDTLLFVEGSVTSTSGSVALAADQTQGAACAAGYEKYVFSVGTIDVGATPNVSYKATVKAPAVAGAQLINTATITTSSLPDGLRNPSTERVSSANTTATVTVQGATTAKTADKPRATIGESVTFTVTETVPANVTLYNASVIDTVPDTMSFGSATVSCATVQATPVSCNTDIITTPDALTPANSKIGWYLGDIAAKTYPRTVTIVYTGIVTDVSANVSAPVQRALTNTALLQWNAAPGVRPENANATQPNNTGTSTATVRVVEPALSIKKTVNSAVSAILEVGVPFTYGVTVTNKTQTTPQNTVSSAFNTTVTDVVPSGVVASLPATLPTGQTVTKSTAAGQPGGTITWTIAGPVAPGASLTLQYSGTFVGSTALPSGGQVNSAKITGYTSLASGAGMRTYPASSAVTATVTPKFPLVTLGKSVASGDTAYVGQPFGWSLTATNSSAAATGVAASVTLVDTLPVNWSYTSTTSISIGGVPYTGPLTTPVYDPATRTITWGPFPNLAPGAQIAVAYQATPSNGAAIDPGLDTAHRNTLTAVTTDATGATSHLGTGGAQSSYTGALATADAFIRSADVQVTKVKLANIPAGGSAAAFSITVKNNGPDTAVGPFTVADITTGLPAGVTVTGISGSGWSCSLASLACTRNDSLTSGASFGPITVTMAAAPTVPASTRVPNTATVMAKTFDPNLENNTSTAETSITAEADVSIVKTVTNVDTVRAGETISYDLAVRNIGPADSLGTVTVTDEIDASVSDIVVTAPDGWTCAVTGQTLECTTPDLAFGALVSIPVTGTIASDFEGTLSNTASVDTTTTDPNPDNDSSTTETTVDSSTSITLNKTLASTEITAGAPVDYSFQVINNGPADARSITLSDTLPAGLTFVGIVGQTAPAGLTWTCSEPGSSQVDCTLVGTLAAGDDVNSTTLVLRALVPSDADLSQPIENTATASAANAEDSTASTDSSIVGSADLAIVKSHTDSEGVALPAVAGESLEYTLAVSNNGPSDSPSTVDDRIHVRDDVPVGMTATGVDGGADWQCEISEDGATVDCDYLTTLVAGTQAEPIVVTVAIAPDAGRQTLVNTADVSGPLDDPDALNNESDDSTEVTADAGVEIVKTATPATAVAGETATFTIVVTGTGPSFAYSPTVTDTLPTGLTINSVNVDGGSGWSCDATAGGDSFSCEAPSLALGSENAATITVVANLDKSILDGTILTNTGTVQWTDSSTEPHSESDSADVTVSAVAALALEKSARADSVVAGTTVGFDLVLSNDGPSDAVAPVKIVDTLPEGLTFVSTDTQGDWNCAVDAQNAQLVTCELTEERGLAVGTPAPTLGIIALVSAGASAGELVNSAQGTSPTDADGSNTATAPIVVAQDADLSIVKSHDPSLVRIGGDLPFTLTVTNAGPSTATGVVITDLLPRGLTFVSATGVADEGDASPIVCEAAEANADGETPVSCALDAPLAADESVSVTVVATVEAAADPTVVNTAQVTAETPDGHEENNSTTDEVAVAAQVDLSVTKSHTGDLTQGSNAGYTIVVSNAGPTEDPGPITVVDTLPAGLSYVSSTGEGTNCSADGQVVTCELDGALAVGGSATISITVAVSAAAGSTIENTVVVGSSAEDLDPLNDTASDSGFVLAATPLPNTGLTVALQLSAAMALLLLGGLLLVRRRRATA